MKMKKRWTLLFSVLLGIFSCVAVSTASAQQVEVLNGAMGESITFPTRVPTSANIMYEGRTIGQVLNKQNDTGLDEKFKNRLHWSSEFFTLSDLRSDDSGLYTVENTREERAKQSYQLNVYDKVSKPQVTTSNHPSPESDLCSLQCSVRNVIGLKLSWFRGNVLLNHTSSSSPDTTLNLPLEIQQIDKDIIFSCEASNPVSKQNTTVNSTELCLQESGRKSDDKRSYISIAIVCCVLLVLAVIAMFIYTRRKKHETSRRSKDSSATEGLQEDVQYSEINHTPKKRIQGNIRESAPQETSLLTTIYDRIRPHQAETSTPSDSA